MDILVNLTIADIQQIALMITSHSESKNAIYIGAQPEILAQELRRAGLQASGYPEDLSRNEIGYPEDFDAVIVHWKMLFELDSQFIATCARKHIEYWVIYPLLDNSPEFLEIYQLLMGFGFLRDPRVELWVSDRILLCRYLYSDDLLYKFNEHESEWWRLVQANRKYQNLVGEYYKENAMLLAASNELVRRNQELQQRITECLEANNSLQASNRSLSERWDAFWKSRTGKTILILKNITRR